MERSLREVIGNKLIYIYLFIYFLMKSMLSGF